MACGSMGSCCDEPGHWSTDGQSAFERLLSRQLPSSLSYSVALSEPAVEQANLAARPILLIYWDYGYEFCTALIVGRSNGAPSLTD
jgi:hypothetical protein